MFPQAEVVSTFWKIPAKHSKYSSLLCGSYTLFSFLLRFAKLYNFLVGVLYLDNEISRLFPENSPILRKGLLQNCRPLWPVRWKQDCASEECFVFIFHWGVLSTLVEVEPRSISPIHSSDPLASLKDLCAGQLSSCPLLNLAFSKVPQGSSVRV